MRPAHKTLNDYVTLERPQRGPTKNLQTRVEEDLYLAVARKKTVSWAKLVRALFKAFLEEKDK